MAGGHFGGVCTAGLDLSSSSSAKATTAFDEVGVELKNGLAMGQLLQGIFRLTRVISLNIIHFCAPIAIKSDDCEMSYSCACCAGRFEVVMAQPLMTVRFCPNGMPTGTPGERWPGDDGDELYCGTPK